VLVAVVSVDHAQEHDLVAALHTGDQAILIGQVDRGAPEKPTLTGWPLELRFRSMDTVEDTTIVMVRIATDSIW